MVEPSEASQGPLTMDWLRLREAAAQAETVVMFLEAPAPAGLTEAG